MNRCLHRHFENYPDVLEEFFSINNYINIDVEPIEDLTVRHGIPISWLKNKTVFTCNVKEAEKLYKDFKLVTFELLWLYDSKRYKSEDIDIDKDFVSINGSTSIRRQQLVEHLKSKNGYISYWGGGYNEKLPSESNAKSHYTVKHNTPVEFYKGRYVFEIETGGENGIQWPCITEKTFRPLLLGKPFLHFGYKGYYDKLKQYGFKFEDYTNYSSFNEYLENIDKMLIKEPDWKLVEYNKNLAEKIRKKNLLDFDTWLTNTNNCKTNLTEEMKKLMRTNKNE